MVSAHCCLAGLGKCTRLYVPPPVTFSIATRIAEETKRKFVLLWQRCGGGGVRFLGDGRRTIINDVVQGFHVDTRLVAAALVRSLLLLLHHPCLWSSQGPDLCNWSFQHMLCQDLQPLLTLRSPEILCWLPYKPLSDQSYEPDETLVALKTPIWGQFPVQWSQSLEHHHHHHHPHSKIEEKKQEQEGEDDDDDEGRHTCTSS